MSQEVCPVLLIWSMIYPHVWSAQPPLDGIKFKRNIPQLSLLPWHMTGSYAPDWFRGVTNNSNVSEEQWEGETKQAGHWRTQAKQGFRLQDLTEFLSGVPSKATQK